MSTHDDHHDAPIGRILTRRQALALFTSPLLLGLAGCTDSRATDGPLTGSCVVRPQLTAGPFYLDTDLVRADIREGKPGVPLALSFAVSRVVENECVPLENAVVDIWHADASGNYSGVGRLADERFLRGVQTTDASGQAAFTTIYPGWYRGRTPHIHFKVRSSADSVAAYAFTSQLFFDDELSRTVYTSVDPYTDRGVMDVTNVRDGIYRRGGSDLLLNVAETDEGYAASFDIALYMD